jgi:hypothetical protein
MVSLAWPALAQTPQPGGITFSPTNPTTCDLLVINYAPTGTLITSSATQIVLHLSFNDFITETTALMFKQTNGTWEFTNQIPPTAVQAKAKVVDNNGSEDNNFAELWSVSIAACSSNPVPVTFAPTVITPCSDVAVTYSASGTIFAAASQLFFFISFDNSPDVTAFKPMTEGSGDVWTVSYDIPEGPANAIVFFTDGSSTNEDNNVGTFYSFAISVCDTSGSNFFFSVRSDMDGDGLGDLVLKDEEDAIYSILLMDGLESIDKLDLLGTPTDINPLKYVATADLDGDGVEDMIFRDGDSGDHIVAFMAGGEVADAAYLTFGGETDVSPWHVVAGGDLDADGFGDLVYQQGDSGVYAIGYFDGEVAIASEFLFGGTEPLDVSPWRCVAGGDLDGDGNSDLVFKYGKKNIYAIGFMDGATFLDSAYFMGSEIDISPWKLVATSDLDGDGFTELIFKFGGEDLYDAAFMDAENVLLSDFLFDSAPIGPDEVVGGR